MSIASTAQLPAAATLAVLVALVTMAPAEAVPQHHTTRHHNAHDSSMNKGLRQHLGLSHEEFHANEASTNVSVMWFSQTLDHFNRQDTRTFKQQYQVNRQYYKAGGPTFLLLGGEGPASTKWLEVDSAVMLYAKEYDAVVVQLEHRFYGKSQPFSDLSTANLRYLSSEQALADAAGFLRSFSPNSKAIVFGGSYSGALAAFFRTKYPHIVQGAVSTSSPVEALLNFTAYQEIVGRSLEVFSSGCTNAVRDATAKIEGMMSTANGRKQLIKDFNVCSSSDLSSVLDQQTFYSNLAQGLDGVVQYNRDNVAFEGRSLDNITYTCSLITGASDSYSGYMAAQKYLQGNECQDASYADMVAEMKNTSLSSDVAGGSRQWVYQTCVEFGFYQSSDSPNQPFGSGFPLKYSVQQCSDIYGIAGPDTTWTNDNYGGYHVAGTNIVYANGLVDPWHYLSVLEGPFQEGCDAFIMPRNAHCSNMYPPSSTDEPELTKARAGIMDYIGTWLSSN